MDARDDGRVEGIVWLEKGDEVAFEPSGPRRPWLEESLQWAAHDEPAPEPPEPKGSELIWL